MNNEPEQPTQAVHLPRYTWWHVVTTALSLLPPPLDDTPQALFARDQTALAQIADMAPVNSDEATIAAQCVVARARAEEAARAAQAGAGDATKVRQADGQFAQMQRTAMALRNQLHKLQGTRARRDEHPKTADADAWTRHIAVDEMQRALKEGLPLLPPSALPAEVAVQPRTVLRLVASGAPTAVEQDAASSCADAPPPAGADGPPAPWWFATQPPPASHAPAADPEPAPAAPPKPARRASRACDDLEDPPRDLDAEVIYWAAVHPKRVQEIRSFGGVPPDCTYGPPDPELARAIVSSRLPAVCELDPPCAAE